MWSAPAAVPDDREPPAPCALAPALARLPLSENDTLNDRVSTPDHTWSAPVSGSPTTYGSAAACMLAEPAMDG